MRRRMEVPRTIFRAYDIRGIYGGELTLATAERVGATFAAYHASKGTSGRICIGRDARTSSPDLEAAVIAGLRSGGCDVESVGMVPIPVANWWTWRGDFAGGVYITASHNPAEYNGIRFRHPDGTGFTDGNTEVRDLFFAGAPPSSAVEGDLSHVPEEEVLELFATFAAERIGSLEGMKIALDPGNGVGGVILESLFQRFGATTEIINGEPDGSFPNRPSEPAPKNIGALMSLVAEGDFDCGIAFDGDCDRCVFVDDLGRAVQTEKIGIILARELLKLRRGPVLANVPCSMVLEDEIPKLGAKLVWIRVGDVFVCEELKKHDAVLALEISAHLFAPDLTEFLFDDPLIISLKVAELLHGSGRTLAALADEIPSLPYEELKFTCPDEIKFDLNTALQADFTQRGYRVETIDGVKVWLDDGWVLLRPSNTQPVMRMFVEARTPERMLEIKAEFIKEYEKTLASLSG
jgi:phosphomannomutase|tara:strand:+ start:346 stop:1737 length:1392 start_codon:yes stop_codon:yes gene_type:complete